MDYGRSGNNGEILGDASGSNMDNKSTNALQEPIISSGDIVIGEGDNSRKRISIVIGVVAVLIIVAVVVVCLIFFLNTKGDRAAFNNYANYLLYGTESNDDITGDYVWGYRYYAHNIDVMASESYEDYLDTLKGKYESLKLKAGDKISDYDDIFWLFYYCSMYPAISGQITVTPESNSEEWTDFSEDVKTYYTPYLESDNLLVQKFGAYLMGSVLSGDVEEVDVPDYNIDIFSMIWKMKGEFYE